LAVFLVHLAGGVYGSDGKGAGGSYGDSGEGDAEGYAMVVVMKCLRESVWVCPFTSSGGTRDGDGSVGAGWWM
jgi:hypothetical protein